MRIYFGGILQNIEKICEEGGGGMGELFAQLILYILILGFVFMILFIMLMIFLKGLKGFIKQFLFSFLIGCFVFIKTGWSFHNMVLAIIISEIFRTIFMIKLREYQSKQNIFYL